jgi:Xaa-Pro aminopeptidase
MANSAYDNRISDIQTSLRTAGFDGWLFYSFHMNNPVAEKILEVPRHFHQKRRYYYYVPANGTPQKLVHSIERGTLDHLPGERNIYASWQELESGIRKITGGAKRIAMEYSAECAIPYISIVDAGTIETVRKVTGAEIVSSADLVQMFDAVWDDDQLASHEAAGKILITIADEAFAHIGKAVREGKIITEYDVQQFIKQQFTSNGLHTDDAPNCSVNANAGDPHYDPIPATAKPIGENDLVLIDLWAKQTTPRAVYADYTRMGFVGKNVPEKYSKAFAVVCKARDRATEFLNERVTAGKDVYGWEVDDACRKVIQDAGYGDQFIHRTGHSIGENVHGNGANIDNLETRDNRRIIPRTCFSIEPGIYVYGEFGVRTEVNVYISDRRSILVTGMPLQHDIHAILK